jgi:hypothetical protein
MNEHYAVVLADLKQMKADAEAGIVAIERLMARAGTPANHKPHSPEPESPPHGQADKQTEDLGIPNRVLAFLRENPHGLFTTEAIHTGIGTDVNLKTLRGALSRMALNTKIERVGRGKFRTLSQASGTPT